MYDLAIFAALGWERRAVTAALGRVEPAGRPRTWRGTLGDGASCLVVQTGLGLRRAGAAAEGAPPARRFLTCGCAGGLVASLRTGDLVAASGIIPFDAQGRAGNRLAAEHAELATWAATARLSLHVGDVASSAVPLCTVSAKVAAATTGALAVEMENAAVAAVARTRQVPFSSLRVVLDAFGDELPLSLDVIDEDGELRATAAIGLVLQPRLWSALVRLVRQRRTAEARLYAAVVALAQSGLTALAAS
jgi:nucleoside phosphorylase